MPGGRPLLAVASPVEADAVLRALGRSGEPPALWRLIEAGRADVLVTGVGKANAAGAVARLLDPGRHSGVLSVGVCGSLPGGPGLGSVVLASSSVFADEGLAAPDGFRDCRAMGFPLSGADTDALSPAPAWRDALLPLVDAEGVVATVSTCSGTDALASEVRERTGAIAEAMEGAAVGLAAARVAPGLAFAEVRAVSNTTGDRDRQTWELAPALGALSRVLGRLLAR